MSETEITYKRKVSPEAKNITKTIILAVISAVGVAFNTVYGAATIDHADPELATRQEYLNGLYNFLISGISGVLIFVRHHFAKSKIANQKSVDASVSAETASIEAQKSSSHTEESVQRNIEFFVREMGILRKDNDQQRKHIAALSAKVTELTEKVGELTNEIGELRTENRYLRQIAFPDEDGATITKD